MYQSSAYENEFQDSPKYLKRKVKSGHVTADYDKCDLVLTYEVEATVVGDTGKAMQTERKTHQMHLKVKLDAHTDVKAYANQLVQSSDLIPNSKVDHVENLLYSLKQHILQDRHRADSIKKVKRDCVKKKKEEIRRQNQKERQRLENQQKKEELAKACMEDLDEYLEKLYDEDIAAKVRGTGMVRQLAREAGNLEDLLENDALMGALSRTLKEDSKRSMDLALNLMNIFFSFSNFTQFHQSLHSYQIGNKTMQIIKWELKRYEARLEEMKLLEKVAEAQEQGIEPEFDPRKSKKRGEPVNMDRERAKTKTLQRKQDKFLFVCLHVLLNLAEDEKVEKKMAKRDLVEDLVQILNGRTINTELLILTATFIKKLSLTRENKDALRDLQVVDNFVKYVPCSNQMLMQIVLRTLFNLSFDMEIREQMVKNSMIPKLVDLLQNKHFRSVALRILYHLSIDDRCKSMFTYTEVIPYMMRIIIEFPANQVANELAALAINLSLNDRNCGLMVQGSNFKQLTERAIRRRDPLLMKVVRNLSRWTLSMQEELPEPGKAGSKRVEEKDFDDEDPIARERSRIGEKKAPTYKYKKLWEPHVQELTHLMLHTENSDLMVEIIGIFANLTPSDLPKGTSFADLIIEHDLVEFVHKHLLPGFSEDDILLEVIMLIGQFCLDQAAARLLANSPLIKLIYDLLHEKKEDSEIVLQTLYTFHRLLRHKETGHTLLYETQMPRDVCDLLKHPNKVVRVMADNLLDLIVDHDEATERAMIANRRTARKSAKQRRAMSEGKNRDVESSFDDENPAFEDEKLGELSGSVSKMIRANRFAIHNREWIEVVAQEDLDDLEDDHPDFDQGSPGVSDFSESENNLDDSHLGDSDDISTEY